MANAWQALLRHSDNYPVHCGISTVIIFLLPSSLQLLQTLFSSLHCHCLLPQPDKTGRVQTEKLRAVLKDFELTVDLDALIEEVDRDHSGTIDYEEFRQVLEQSPKAPKT